MRILLFSPCFLTQETTTTTTEYFTTTTDYYDTDQLPADIAAIFDQYEEWDFLFKFW